MCVMTVRTLVICAHSLAGVTVKVQHVEPTVKMSTWQGFWWAKWDEPVKTWYTGPCMSGLYHWGGWGQATENLVHWTSHVRFVPLGRMGEGQSSLKIN